jgi:aromatic-L-amino-acid decarboxylase
MNQPTGPIDHLTGTDFEAACAVAARHVAAYWDRLRGPEAPPVLCPEPAGATLSRLGCSPPDTGEPIDAILADVARVIAPGLTHWQSPGFFAYFPASTTGPSVLADLLCAGLGVQGMLWATSPAATELEVRMMDWAATLLGLPERFLSGDMGRSNGRPLAGGGVIQGTASEAAVAALCAARHRARGTGARSGKEAGPLVAYTSRQAHSSIVKAAMVTGIARDGVERDGVVGGPPAGVGLGEAGGVRLIDTDAQGRIAAADLARAMAADRAAGRRPFFVAATLGTTGTGAVDDLTAVADTCEPHGAWLHADAAWAGAALACPEFRPMLGDGETGRRGIDRTDSLSINPHKWMLTGFDCNLFWTADRAALIGALSLTPEYLRNAASDAGEVWDYRDWHVPLGRRMRALKLWFVLRWYGRLALQAHLREHVRIAGVFETLVRGDPRFELPVERSLSLVVFRLRALPGQPGAERDALNRRLLERVNRAGRVFLSHTALPTVGDHAGGVVLRLAVGATFTREEHVRQAWAEVSAAAAGLLGDTPAVSGA